jgi:hypothetical protein
MLTPEDKALWLEALRSGRYNHGKGQLREVVEDITTYCCLGVFAELKGWVIDGGGRLYEGNDCSYKPFEDIMGAEHVKKLWHMNDGHMQSYPKPKAEGFQRVIPYIEDKM